MTDPVELTADLIRCPSVTPDQAGALDLLDGLLSPAGFRTTRTDRNGVSNLFARFGTTGPVLGFNGHIDVVPPGEVSGWAHDPFGAVVENGVMYGRGAQDMKSAVAAFAAAAIKFAATPPDSGSVVLAITSDEEGPGIDGTVAILDWMDQNGEKIDHCIVGEPTCPNVMGEMIKIGRRGSMTAYITATGVQGHSAYPHRAKNPLPGLISLLNSLSNHELDRGTEFFDASTLAITTVDVGNPANNVIPAEARATVNIRFNDAHDSGSLCTWLNQLAAETSATHGVDIKIRFTVSGESFITQPGRFVEIVSDAISAETGVTPVLSTSGGTSDARFIRKHCPVLEFGLVGDTMHQTDERVEISQIKQLASIYSRILADYFDAGQKS